MLSVCRTTSKESAASHSVCGSEYSVVVLSAVVPTSSDPPLIAASISFHVQL
jgi:hypothetical protein